MDRSIIIVLMFLFWAACGEQEQVDYSGRGDDANGEYVNRYHPGTQARRQGFGSGQYIPPNGGVVLPTRPTSYPIHRFRGSGKIYHRGGEDSLTSHSQFDLSASQVFFRSLDFGSSRSEVTNGLQGLKGVTQFARPSVAELRQHALQSAFSDPGVLIYGSSVVKVNGETLRFSSPIPLAVIGARAHRYAAIPEQGLSYTTQVSGAQNFTLTAIVTKAKESVEGIDIKIDYVLSDQRNYDYWPLPKSVVTSINPQTKRVTFLATTSLFYEAESGQMRSFYLHHQLCEYSFNGQVESYCP